MLDRKWWKESVIYQIYPRSFMDSNGDGIGDLNGVRSKLDYLEKLGVNVIWLSPVYKSPNDDNGYDISDYRDIMDEFGTLQDFELLLDEAHEHGIRVVMDLVVNHTSDEHKWFIESKSSRDNDKRDYYIWREPVDGKKPNNWGSAFSGSAWEWDETTQMYYLHTFSKKQPDLNWDNEKVRKEIFDMMNWWCKKGIDGFRMDVISLISKLDGLPDVEKTDAQEFGAPMVNANGPRVHEYLQEMNENVLSKYDLITVGECPCVNVDEAKKYANNSQTELNMVFQFEHMELDCDEKDGKWTTKKYFLPDLKENLSKWQVELEDEGWNSLYLDNHDQPRIVSRLGDDSPKSAKCIATMLHMMKGTPYIYQGEELGMTNCPFKDISDYRDIESINVYNELVLSGRRKAEELLEGIAYHGRDNARTPMQWSDDENAGFSSNTPWIMVNPNYKTINARAQENDNSSVFSYYKKLIELRRLSEWGDIIVYGKYRLYDKEHEQVFCYTRELKDKKIVVICNLSNREIKYHLPDEISDMRGAELISNDNIVFAREMKLPKWAALVCEIN